MCTVSSTVTLRADSSFPEVDLGSILKFFSLLLIHGCSTHVDVLYLVGDIIEMIMHTSMLGIANGHCSTRPSSIALLLFSELLLFFGASQVL
jgi:hypothetical protein